MNSRYTQRSYNKREREIFTTLNSFQEIKGICDNFVETNYNVLGQGGFGIVYKGRYNGQDVAVKRILDKRRNAGDETFEKCVAQAITELLFLHTFPAENVLPLMAFSFDPTFATDPCLVYQLMPNGSVSDRLKRLGSWATSPPLLWKERANIGMGNHSMSLLHEMCVYVLWLFPRNTPINFLGPDRIDAASTAIKLYYLVF